MLKRIFITLSIISLLAACSKEEEQIETSNEPTLLFPISVGSYWVYEFEWILKDGTIQGVELDSLIVTGTDSFNGNSFFTLSSSIVGNVTMYWRDSSGYIVDQYGNVVLPPTPRQEEEFNRKTHYHHNGDPVVEVWDQFPDYIDYTYKSKSYRSIRNQLHHKLLIDGSNDVVVDEFIYSEIGPMQRSYTYSLSRTNLLGSLIDHHLEQD